MVTLLLGVSLLLFFCRLDSLPLFDADEPAYAETAREMLISGDWITPHFNFQPRFDKPILFYWLIALAYKGFGIGEYAARFWSAVFATGLTLSIYLFGRQRLSRRAACVAALAFAANVGTVALARAAVTDMALAFCTTWALFCFFEVYLATDRTRERLPFAGYVAIALAVLTKGPIGLLLPGLVVGLFLAIRRKGRATLSRLRLLPGIGLFAVIALPWYVLVLRENGWAFVQVFVVQHHLNRYLGVISGHVGGILYFLPVVVFGFFPWSGTLPDAFGRLWTIRSRLRAELSERQELLLFLWVWCGVVVLFFSFSRTKLPSYIFPAVPALALLAGIAGDVGLDERRQAGGWARACDWLVGGMTCSLAAFLLWLPSLADRIRLREAPDIPPFEFGLAPYVLAVLFLLGLTLAVAARRRGQGNAAAAAMAGTMILSLVLAVYRIAPAVQESLQKSLRDFALIARQELRPIGRLATYDLNAPSLVFYSERPVAIIRKGEEAEFQRLMTDHGQLFIIARIAAETRLREVPDIFPLDRRGGYVLYSNRYGPKDRPD
ncbi:Undecaprenyl phosphate-alpha-4-amino-4-deoxy-L-arabinose arabinosyl transferase [Candidatus Methylomirabilis lanthanidiphila]|uniref:Undecaprenyl phosphate-alpha-4-amino-4-deoxy-L-arabinose arabinosyl transferase n=1 Tax=Candidatus Methylomirabilis lanthanidiphila TaxID=2211376 RepID=A0A564ZFS6_9BACT|nr:glycosyltransferase family 39 protein [Candidatus Methylomirabilis lanthanidiphila]VUZ84134.1 Undecaprenyl phosphate-alpha-4-amino-4-deoxy-L-arabinose arabinosyl transferase [Candidatus Methylomirabilis lanthanidiphila]